MQLITWNDTMSVKIAEIDKQHQTLVNMINDLHEAMKSGQAKTIMGKLLEDLSNYTVTHFSYEEMLFEKFSYPMSATHKNEHIMFLTKVAGFKAKFESGSVSLSLEIMDFLKNWLLNHIEGTDKQYSAFLNKNGVV